MRLPAEKTASRIRSTTLPPLPTCILLPRPSLPLGTHHSLGKCLFSPSMNHQEILIYFSHFSNVVLSFFVVCTSVSPKPCIGMQEPREAQAWDHHGIMDQTPKGFFPAKMTFKSLTMCRIDPTLTNNPSPALGLLLQPGFPHFPCRAPIPSAHS